MVRTGLLVLVGLGLAAPLAAQTSVSLDASGSSVAYGDLDRLSSVTVIPALRLDGRRASAVFWGAGSWFEDDSWAVQGAGTATVFTSTSATVRGEFGASAVGRAFSGDVQTGELLGVARAHVTGTRQGAWIGATGGPSWSITDRRMAGIAELGGWLARGPVIVVGRVLPTVVEGEQGYTDVSGTLRWLPRGLQLDVQGGVRVRGSGVEGWVSGAAAVRIVGPLQVVASAGTFLPDPIQGLEGGDFMTLGLRLSRKPPRPVLSPSLVPPPPEAAALRSFRLVRTEAGRVLVEVQAPTLAQVELLGDLTDWLPLPMSSQGGAWRVEVDAPPGSTRLSFRVNGVWVAPPGVPSESDDFGGTIGTVLVPE